MQNPWVRLPAKAPFVLPEDAAAIDSIQAKAGADVRLHTELIPEPFGGRFDAQVVLLDSHPGFSPADVKAHADPGYRDAALNTLTLPRSAWPIYPLDPRFAGTPAGQYSRKLFHELNVALQERLGGSEFEAWQHLARSMLFIHHFPYHREKSAPNQPVPSQEFSFQLVRDALARNALVVIRNARRRWLEAVPALADHKRCCVAKAPLVPALSRRNLPPSWFERMLEALLETPSVVRSYPSGLRIELQEDLTPDQRLRVLRQVEAVVRDSTLRGRVIAAWGAACAVCGLDLAGLTGVHECEVAHVVPVAEDGPDALANALPLCRTHHWAFDEHLWAVEPESRTIHVREDYRDQTSLRPHHGNQLRGRGVALLGRDRLLARWRSYTSVAG